MEWESPVLVDGNIDSQGYSSMLEEHLEASKGMCGLDDTMWFQQDNAPAHSSKTTKGFLASKGVRTLPWPPQSPDMNPIENLWSLIKNELRGKKFPNKKALWNAVQDVWYNIPTSKVQRIIESMPRRLFALRKANGCNTGY